jgi:hypothetical protein
VDEQLVKANVFASLKQTWREEIALIEEAK